MLKSKACVLQSPEMILPSSFLVLPGCFFCAQGARLLCLPLPFASAICLHDLPSSFVTMTCLHHLSPSLCRASKSCTMSGVGVAEQPVAPHLQPIVPQTTSCDSCQQQCTMCYHALCSLASSAVQSGIISCPANGIMVCSSRFTVSLCADIDQTLLGTKQ